MEDPAVIKQTLAHLERKADHKNSAHNTGAGQRTKWVRAGSRRDPFGPVNPPNSCAQK